MNETRRRQGLYDQTIDRVVRGTIEIEGREVDPLVPSREECKIRGASFNGLGAGINAGSRKARQDERSKVLGLHTRQPRASYEGVERRRNRASTMATAAGVTPGTRAACPSVDGRTSVRR